MFEYRDGEYKSRVKAREAVLIVGSHPKFPIEPKPSDLNKDKKSAQIWKIDLGR
jgi:hypothetical protein